MTKDDFKKFRKELGLSQEALGKVLGRSRQQIIGYEQGHAEIPAWAEPALNGLLAARREQEDEAA